MLKSGMHCKVESNLIESDSIESDSIELKK